MDSNDTIYSDGTYLERNQTWHQEDSSWKAEQIWKMLVANKIDFTTVGEIGCGAGGVLRSLAKIAGGAKSYSGYDVSEQAIELAKSNRSEGVECRVGDMLSLDLDFDVVMAIDVFEHVDDYLGFLRRLRPKGRHKVFHIPLDLSVQSVLRGAPILAAREWIGHLHYFTKDTALATLETAGYEVLDWQYTKWCFELPDKRLESRVMWLPRRLLYGIHRDYAVRLLGGFSLLVLAK